MKVILHADDFGFDKDTLDATIECFERGALSSCSVMVNCDASNDAFEYARKHPQFSYGVHLTYVDGLQPVVNPGEIPSLVTNDGVFMQSNELRKKAILLSLSQNDIVLESQAQIDKMLHEGINVSHLDSHGHLHKFPSFLYALKHLKVGDSPANKVRCVQNVFIDKPSKKSPVYWLNKYFTSYLSHHFNNPKFFYMSANNMDCGWADNVLEQMNKMPQNAVIEIGVHPGHSEEWRQHEFNDIIDFASKLRKDCKHEIITWNQL
jgi:hypothetical protein